MKKPDRTTRSLQLSVQTIRELSQPTLTAVVGATSLSCSYKPPCTTTTSAPDGQ